ncbi:MAG: Nif11 family protein [Desulfovibrionaceae bacterium]|nr:Nif11 family protein [Desulfovibrionaceae bacterium]
MSREEVSRLVNDVMSDQAMLAEAMTLTDQASLESFVAARGYDLTEQELAEVWAMAAEVLAGLPKAMDGVG